MDKKLKKLTKQELIHYIETHPTEKLHLSDADLSYAVLSDADLRGAVLSDADLRGAVLSDAVLRGADLSYADLSDAVLRGADLSYADLSYADLSYADLSDADLSDAVLRGADLSYAIIDDYRFVARGLREETIKHIMALDFQWLGKDAQEIIKQAIKNGTCPFKTFTPPFYRLAGHYWTQGIRGYFTTDLSFPEIWKMLVEDLKQNREKKDA